MIQLAMPIFILLLFLLTTTGCHHSSEPPQAGPDTTSHNFVWQIDTLGDGNASNLRDVVIINDTLVYAVDEMYLKDSTGQIDPVLHLNLAIWNGRTWAMQGVPYYYQGSQSYSPIPWIFARDARDIWFGNGVHWDGQAFNNVDIGTSVFYGIGSNKMWGDLSGQLYVVGNSGTIAYSPDHGTSWQKLSSGTTLPIQDIWGAASPSTGQTEILAVASNKFDVPSGKRLLHIQGSTVSILPDTGLPVSLSSVWFSPNKRYYVVGDGLFEKDQISATTPWVAFHHGLTTYYTEAIRGNGDNDIVVAGDFGVLLHYNGSSWRNYQNQTYMSNGSFYAVAIKGNIVAAVGQIGDRAVVLIGKR